MTTLDQWHERMVAREHRPAPPYPWPPFPREAYGTILADPPWQFTTRRGGKVGPEHKRLHRYATLPTAVITTLPLPTMAGHCYLWVPAAMLADGLQVMAAWGFTYKTPLVWYKTRRDGGPDLRSMGFYFRTVTEFCLFGVRNTTRTAAPGRRLPNIILAQKREHSRKPDELYEIIESCSPGPYLELFARQARDGWDRWGDQAP